jgi:hypothetical protein
MITPNDIGKLVEFSEDELTCTGRLKALTADHRIAFVEVKSPKGKNRLAQIAAENLVAAVTVRNNPS